MTEVIHRLRCICRDVRDEANMHAAPLVAARKGVRLAYIIEKYLTFCQECEIFGAPCVVMPLPTWRVWRVQEWWYVEQCRGWQNTECFLSEAHWIRNLKELAPLEKKLEGQFTFRRFFLLSHMWDYDCRWWVEENHSERLPPRIVDDRFNLLLKCRWLVCDRCRRHMSYAGRGTNGWGPHDGAWLESKQDVHVSTFRERWLAGENFLWYCARCHANNSLWL